MQIILPEILKCPPKLLPVITRFNDYQYFLLEGGRGGGKSQFIGRLLLFLGEQREVRIVCGREIQNNIEESVHALLADQIRENDLAYDVTKNKIRHMVSGSEIGFKGFNERGAVNVKGLEGVDILWIDESQAITKTTLDVLDPTIRKTNSKVIFTMNRHMRDDAVYNEYVGRPDCLHIKIDYFENPFCPLKLLHMAELSKNKSMRDYRHIWLGEPLASADDVLFNMDKLYAAYDVEPIGEIFGRQRVMAVDFAAQGNDHCVATILDRVSNVHWEVTDQVTWDEDDSMVSVGRIVDLIGRYKPTINILDIGGMGKVVFDRLSELNMAIIPFDGGSTKGCDPAYTRNRSEGYHLLRDWFDMGYLKLDRRFVQVIKELEKIRVTYLSNGKKELQKKTDMKKDIGFSPDHADSLMMAVWGAIKFIGKDVIGNTQHASTEGGDQTRRISKSKRHG